MDKKDEMSALDEAEVNKSIDVTEQLSKEGNIRLSKAITDKNFVEIASCLTETATKN